jgi:hypothetical protein
MQRVHHARQPLGPMQQVQGQQLPELGQGQALAQPQARAPRPAVHEERIGQQHIEEQLAQ